MNEGQHCDLRKGNRWNYERKVRRRFQKTNTKEPSRSGRGKLTGANEKTKACAAFLQNLDRSHYF
jgi:hypothetical protein